MGADALCPGSKGIVDRAFSRYGVATVVLQIEICFFKQWNSGDYKMQS